ncbi:MAG: integrase arm-type DNA-binding domain-containing protein [Candidatus Riflebacteria bacterium]|nr:integrase arm-type DNA-binding domain-containing protein [Candidatus Riflebacteria bacterium]
MRQIKPLSETQIKNAKPGEKSRSLFDGGGLYLLIQPNGSKGWRFKYTFDGKGKLLSMGIYPEVGLKEARERREEARKLIASGVDPQVNRKAAKAGRLERSTNSFETIAREWLAKRATILSPGHILRIQRQLEVDIFPWIGGKHIAKVTPPEILDVLRRIESRGAIETAHRAQSNISQIFRYAGSTGRVSADPCWNLRGALTPVKKQHLASITEPKKFATLLLAIDNYVGGFVVKSAFKLAPLLFVRPGELRQMIWEEVDLEAVEWNFTASKTKPEFTVPLSTQALKILKEIHPLTSGGKYVFPNPRTPDGSRPLSENAILVALRSLGYTKEEMTGHGFRASARTMLDERLNFRPDFIEAQLAHAVKDPLGRAYNRTKFLKERREMMQAWADYLDELKKSEKGGAI